MPLTPIDSKSISSAAAVAPSGFASFGDQYDFLAGIEGGEPDSAAGTPAAEDDFGGSVFAGGNVAASISRAAAADDVKATPKHRFINLDWKKFILDPAKGAALERLITEIMSSDAQNINLAGYKFTDKAAFVVAYAILQLPSVKEVDFDNCEITLRGKQFIENALKAKKHLFFKFSSDNFDPPEQIGEQKELNTAEFTKALIQSKDASLLFSALLAGFDPVQAGNIVEVVKANTNVATREELFLHDLLKDGSERHQLLYAWNMDIWLAQGIDSYTFVEDQESCKLVVYLNDKDLTTNIPVHTSDVLFNFIKTTGFEEYGFVGEGQRIYRGINPFTGTLHTTPVNFHGKDVQTPDKQKFVVSDICCFNGNNDSKSERNACVVFTFNPELLKSPGLREKIKTAFSEAMRDYVPEIREVPGVKRALPVLETPVLPDSKLLAAEQKGHATSALTQCVITSDNFFELLNIDREDVCRYLIDCADDNDVVAKILPEAKVWHAKKYPDAKVDDEKDRKTIYTKYVEEGIRNDKSVKLSLQAVVIYVEESGSFSITTMVKRKTMNGEEVVETDPVYTYLSPRRNTDDVKVLFDQKKGNFTLLTDRDIKDAASDMMIVKTHAAGNIVPDKSMANLDFDDVGVDLKSSDVAVAKIQNDLSADLKCDLIARTFDMDGFDEALYTKGCNFRIFDKKPADLILSFADSKSVAKLNENYRDSYILIKYEPITESKFYYITTAGEAKLIPLIDVNTENLAKIIAKPQVDSKDSKQDVKDKLQQIVAKIYSDHPFLSNDEIRHIGVAMKQQKPMVWLDAKDEKAGSDIPVYVVTAAMLEVLANANKELPLHCQPYYDEFKKHLDQKNSLLFTTPEWEQLFLQFKQHLVLDEPRWKLIPELNRRQKATIFNRFNNEPWHILEHAPINLINLSKEHLLCLKKAFELLPKKSGKEKNDAHVPIPEHFDDYIKLDQPEWQPLKQIADLIQAFIDKNGGKPIYVKLGSYSAKLVTLKDQKDFSNKVNTGLQAVKMICCDTRIRTSVLARLGGCHFHRLKALPDLYLLKKYNLEELTATPSDSKLSNDYERTKYFNAFILTNQEGLVYVDKNGDPQQVLDQKAAEDFAQQASTKSILGDLCDVIPKSIYLTYKQVQDLNLKGERYVPAGVLNPDAMHKAHSNDKDEETGIVNLSVHAMKDKQPRGLDAHFESRGFVVNTKKGIVSHLTAYHDKAIKTWNLPRNHWFNQAYHQVHIDFLIDRFPNLTTLKMFKSATGLENIPDGVLEIIKQQVGTLSVNVDLCIRLDLDTVFAIEQNPPHNLLADRTPTDTNRFTPAELTQLSDRIAVNGRGELIIKGLTRLTTYDYKLFERYIYHKVQSDLEARRPNELPLSKMSRTKFAKHVYEQFKARMKELEEKFVKQQRLRKNEQRDPVAAQKAASAARVNSWQEKRIEVLETSIEGDSPEMIDRLEEERGDLRLKLNKGDWANRMFKSADTPAVQQPAVDPVVAMQSAPALTVG